MRILDDDQLEGKLLLLVADLLTVMLLTVGSAVSFASGYQLYLDMGAVIMFCAFSGAAAAVLHRLNQPWGALGAAAGIALIFRLAWEKLAPALALIAQRMNLLPVLTGLAARVPDRDEMLPAFLLLCAALAWLMGWIAVRARRWYLAAMLSLSLLLPAIQSGVLPAWGAMLAVFAGWGSMLLTSLYSRKDPGSLGRAQLLSLGGMAGLILILVLTLPMTGYVRPQWATDARTNLILSVTRKLEQFMDLDELNRGILADLNIDLSIDGQGGAAGGSGASESGPGGGTAMREDLRAAGPRRYSNLRVLSLRTDRRGSGRIYLRGNALGVYTGTSWEMAEGNMYPFFPGEDAAGSAAEPSLYPAAAFDGAGYAMSIRDILHRGVYYYPYQPLRANGHFSESGWLTLTEEGNAVPLDQLEYQVEYAPGSPEDGFRSLTGPLAAEEEIYRRRIVRTFYMNVPPATQNLLRPLLDGGTIETVEDAVTRQQIETAVEETREQLQLPDGMDTAQRFRAVIAAASRTARLLDTLAVYDPDTPAMPDDYTDFVASFLESGRGYCIHFATAGTLLLRMQGIPARYVTGYVARLGANGRGEAMDSDAHAWVEVYIDGYGWYPVEMTPGYAGGESGADLAGAPAEEELDVDGELTPDGPEEEPEQTEDAPEDLPEETELPAEETEEESAPPVYPWKAVLAAALTLGALAGAYALSFLPRKLAREHEDTNRSVICAYRRYRRTLKRGGEAVDVMEELGRKAKFSQHTLTAEERELAWNRLDEAALRFRDRLPKWERLLFPLLKPLL